MPISSENHIEAAADASLVCANPERHAARIAAAYGAVT